MQQWEVFKTSSFTHKNLTYAVSATVNPSNPGEVKIYVTQAGLPVVITYPDGYKATLGYYLDLETRLDFAHAFDASAVDAMMKTAESDIKQLV